MVHAGFLTASLLLLAGAALGQTPAQDSFEPDAAATWAQAFGLTRVAGALHAAGPSYAAEIAPGGITVIPVLGTSSARSSSLALALDSIWRGNTRILVAAKPEPAPEHDGLLVRVPRGEGIEERFAVQRDGVEHSFVFAHPLPGSGDLVVRLRADTELEPTPVGDELHFTRQGVSGVAIGAVTGIDADGRRAPGTLRHRAGHVEYRLPGWFVESARYPLVLDPVLGAPVTVRPLGTVPVADPDVAFDASTGTYLVVWAHGASAGAMAIQGQRVSATGALVGGLITIHPAAAGEVVGHPSVASVNTANRFVVAYEHTPPAGDITIRARAIDAASGAVSANSTLVSSQGGIGARRPDLGGRSGAGVIALVAWETVTTSEIRARTLIVSSGPVVQPPAVSGSEVTVASAAGIDEHNPAVCRHDAGTGNYLVVWERVTSSSTLVGGRVLGSNSGATLLTPITTLTPGTGADERDPDCATEDGSRFFVVYEALGLGIAGRPATYSAAAGTLAVGAESALAIPTPPSFPPNSTAAVGEPAVDWAAARYLVAYRNLVHRPAFAGNPDTTVRSVRLLEIGPAACILDTSPEILESGTTTNLQGSNGDQLDAPAVCATFSGDRIRTDGQALVTWRRSRVASTGIPPQPTFTYGVGAGRAQALGPGGPVVDLAPACGGAGTAGVTGPAVIGNPHFGFTLTGLPAGTTATLFNLNLVGPRFDCGPCQILPYSIVLVVAGAGGTATLPVPIRCDPALVSGAFAVQWTVLANPTTPCTLLPQLGFSNVQSVTIGS